MTPTTDGARQAGVHWHTLTADEALSRLGSGEQGLTAAEAAHRLEVYGPNRLAEEKRKSALRRFLAQFNDFMIWVLLGAVVISALLPLFQKSGGDYWDSIVIMVIVLLNATLGFVQESRAESALAELKKLSAPTVKVVRDGIEETVPAEALVPGDLMLLEAGDQLAADGRLVSEASMRADESSLTGESVAVDKDTRALSDAEAAVGDRVNMVFTGTHVEYGRGSAVVTTTGQDTEMGQIAQLLEEGEPQPTPLQLELRDVGKRIVYICLAVVVVVFIAGVARGNPLATMLLFAVSLAVAAIPEGLPAIVTITLANGTKAMARQHAIVRHLPAVETLGSADFICSDKTGTLTLNRMTVTDVLFSDGTHHLLQSISEGQVHAFHRDAFHRMAEAAALCNDARRGPDGAYRGEATEVALLEAAEQAGLAKAELEEQLPRVREVPFDSDRKMMTTAHGREDGQQFMVASKGAAEAVLERCTTAFTALGERPLTPETRSRLLAETAELGSQGLRTLAVAVKQSDTDAPGELERELMFLGAFALQDPPRPEVNAALDACRHAHVQVSMVTGDHRATADAVARELGIRQPGSRVIEGHELERMSAEQLAHQVEQISVYARVSPRHKVKIVEALQSHGHIVAMTGDGVNDAPALRRADIGVAMGVTGTDVAKGAADMVLADDNFATIVSAVRQGRVIFDNLKKFIYFLLSCNISEVLTMFVALLVGLPLPLLPVQVLWINLVTDGLPALALGVDTADKDVMDRRPRSVGENILAWARQRRLLLMGIAITAGALASFVLSRYLLGYDWSLPGAAGAHNLAAARTVLFTTMVLSQVFHSYNLRSEKRSLFSSVPWENRFLLGSFLISIALQAAVLYLPFMRTAFHTVAPSAAAWGLILACALIPVLLIDRVKVIAAKRSAGG